MKLRARTPKLAAAFVVALSLVGAACGNDEETAETTAAETAAPETAAPAETTAAETVAAETAAPEETTAPAETAAAETAAAAATGDATKVKLQLQWFAQAQFAGYYAALDQGFYAAQGLDVEILEGGVDIVPQTKLAGGDVDFAIAWVPKALASREQGAGITNISQVFQRSGTLQVSWADNGIAGPADLKGKKVGNWGFGNEFELFAGMTKAGLDPATDVTLVQQQFDMQALLKREIDAAQAMIYNEYAQVLEAKNPDTGELYKPEDFAVINWNETGDAMLQDSIWANSDKLKNDPAYKDTATKFVAASLQGWAFCRDNVDKCVEIVLAKGSKLGTSHQTWQMNEINKLIWPSPAAGVGTVEQALWDQTVKVAQEAKNAEGSTVLTKAPDADAYNSEVNAAAIELLKTAGVDVVGDGFTPIEVTLTEGGA